MKTRLIKKIFYETYEFRWIKKLKKFIKQDKKNWLNLRSFQTQANKDSIKRKLYLKEIKRIEKFWKQNKNIDIKNIPF